MDTDECTLEEAIQKWVSVLPRWQKHAVSLLNEHATLSDAQVDEVYRLLLADEGLSDTEELPEIDVFTMAGGAEEGVPKARFTLAEMRSLRNVNALPEKEVLRFGKALTIVYGANASGKSGYARVLEAATGSSRSQRQVLPNVYKQESGPQGAEIVLADEDGEQCITTWTTGQPCPEMSHFRFFDSDAARLHVTAKSQFDFEPSSLAVFGRLCSLITGELDQKLATYISDNSPENEFQDDFPGDTKAANFVRTLGCDTDLSELATLATLSPKEKKRIELLGKNIDRLGASGIDKQQSALQTEKVAYQELSEKISDLAAKLSDDVLTDVRAALCELASARSTAHKLGVEQFSRPELNIVGTETWRQFIQTAQQLAAEEAEARDKPYPAEGDICLFCQQELSDTAITLVSAYWEYLEESAEQALNKANDRVQELKETLAALTFDLVSSDKKVAALLEDRDPQVLRAVRKCLARLKVRRCAIVRLLEGAAIAEPPVSPPPQKKELDALVQQVAEQIEDLNATAVEEKLTQLESEQTELSDRKRLADIRSRVKDFVAKHRSAAAAETVQTKALNTKSVTDEHKRISRRFVTESYKQRFRHERERLGCPLPLGVEVKGERGRGKHWLGLNAEQECEPSEVLSEGEQCAAALADFLTEVNENQRSAGIILDDPVNSLDHKYREKIAKRLAKEAATRQVIIFTHALDFCYFLKREAEALAIDCRCHWVEQLDTSTPGAVSNDAGPATERDYRKLTEVERAYERARNSRGEERERAIRDGFAAARTHLEAFIIYRILNEVVTRFEDRVNVKSLDGMVHDKGLIKRVIALHGKVSRFIRAHSHSDIYQAAPPEIDDLKEFLEELRGLQADFKRLGKAHKN